MSDQEPDESGIAKWPEQAEPFVEDLIKIVNKHMSEVPFGAMVFSMAHFLALYMEVHATDPEKSKALQTWAHSLIDTGFEQSRKNHAKGTLSKMFPTVQ